VFPMYGARYTTEGGTPQNSLLGLRQSLGRPECLIVKGTHLSASKGTGIRVGPGTAPCPSAGSIGCGEDAVARCHFTQYDLRDNRWFFSCTYHNSVSSQTFLRVVASSSHLNRVV